MANVVLIVGESGTGKSTSIESLNAKETFLINCANKPLPFKGSAEKYKTGINTVATYDANTIVGLLNEISAKRPEIKNIIIDDANFIMTELFFKKSQETGFTKFTDIAKAFQSVLSAAKNLKPELNVAVFMHEENIASNSIIVGKKPKTVGKLVDDQYSPEAVVSIALYTSVLFGKDGQPEYQFITNRCIVNGVTTPAKSPKGMFPTLKVDNNLEEVFTAARNYYN